MTGQLVIHKSDDLDWQRTQRRVSEHTRGSERRPHIRLQFRRHQSGGESFAADVGAQDCHALRVDDDDIVRFTAASRIAATFGNGNGNSDC
jgi:hypothetical protein